MRVGKLAGIAGMAALLLLAQGCQAVALPADIPAPTSAADEMTAPALVEQAGEFNHEFADEVKAILDEADKPPGQTSEPETPPGAGRLVAIDPGHQRHGNAAQEPNGPGSTVYRNKVASGTRGVATGVPEFELVLDVSLLLRDELMARGYDVLLIRESHDVDISNAARAQMAAEAGADVFIRIHADGSENQTLNGIMTISHTPNNPYIPQLYAQSRALSDVVLQEMLAATGANSRGVWETDSMTGTNWAAMPVTIVEMGLLTNPEEDRLMQTPAYQLKLAEGIANGIDLFFAMHDER